MTRKFTGSVSTNKVGSEDQFEFEVADDATEEQIEEAGREAMLERIEWFYTEEAEDGGDEE